MYGPQPLPEQNLQITRPSHEIVDSTNALLQLRAGLNGERQQRLDKAHVRATSAILAEAQKGETADILAPRVLPSLIISTWNRYAKSHDKANKRMMTSAEATTKDADKAEAAEKVAYGADIQAIAARAAEAVAIDEALAQEIAAAAASDSDS